MRGPPGGERRFVLAAATCPACPLRARCVAGVGGRTVALHPPEALRQDARVFQANPAFAQVPRRRLSAHHRIARLVQLGIRQAPDVGRAKTLFHLAMAAAVANLTLLAAADAALSLSAPAVTFLGPLIVSRVTLSVRPSAVTDDAWPRAPSPCLSLSAQPK